MIMLNSPVWKRLTSAGSHADGILQDLLEGRGEFHENMENLGEDLSHQLSWYSATSYALPHLAALCPRLSKADKVHLVAQMGAAIAAESVEPLKPDTEAFHEFMDGQVCRRVLTEGESQWEYSTGLKRNMNEPTKVGSKSDTAKSGQQEAPMEAALKDLYNQLAQQILAMIPGKWEMVYYLGEVEKERNSWSSVFYFKDPDRGEFVDSNTIPKVYQVPNSVYMEQWLQLNKILLEVYDHFAARKQPLWEQMSFSFDKTGKFHVDFNYDVMHDEDGGQLGRELVWAHRTFGYEPVRVMASNKNH